MLLLVGVEELVEFFILVITLGTGIMVVEVMDGAMGGVLEMYMGLRGPGGITKWIVEPIGTFINGISGSLLPGKTVATAVGIWVINHPEALAKAIAVVGKFVGDIAQQATSAITGGAGGGRAPGVATASTAESGASAARSRMTTATGSRQGKSFGGSEIRSGGEAPDPRSKVAYKKYIDEQRMLVEAAPSDKETVKMKKEGIANNPEMATERERLREFGASQDMNLGEADRHYGRMIKEGITKKVTQPKKEAA